MLASENDLSKKLTVATMALTIILSYKKDSYPELKNDDEHINQLKIIARKSLEELGVSSELLTKISQNK